MAPSSGSIIAGRYEILDTIGHGGMAHVFRARRRSDGRLVALKILYENYANAPEFVARFQREARAAASLTHPHIVRVLDSGHDRGVRYIVMEHVEGETLKQLIVRGGPLPAERACAIAAQVCDALEYAHSRGIVHRDIKPQNILVAPDGAVKVADFGIARAIAASTITQPGSVVGSAQYLSPEQARGDAAGKASDLYALGIVLYEMVTGRLPFEGESPVALALKHLQDTPPPPRSLDERIPPRVEQIVLRAMAKQPELRYATAAEMRDDLTGRSNHWQDAPTLVLPPEEETAVLPAASGTVAAPQPLPAPPRRSMPVVALVALSLFTVLLMGWLALGTPGWRALLGASSRSAGMVVPDLRGMMLARAEALAAERGLQVDVKGNEFHESYPKDVVIGQDPAPGARVPAQSIVSLVLSRGSAKAQQEAQRQEEARKRDEAEARKREEDGKKPKKGVEEQKSSDAGQQQETVQVPDLTGLPLEEAIALLRQSGLLIGVVEQTTLAGGSPGHVISQLPEARSRVPPGTTVNILVSAGE